MDDAVGHEPTSGCCGKKMDEMVRVDGVGGAVEQLQDPRLRMLSSSGREPSSRDWASTALSAMRMAVEASRTKRSGSLRRGPLLLLGTRPKSMASWSSW